MFCFCKNENNFFWKFSSVKNLEKVSVISIVRCITLASYTQIKHTKMVHYKKAEKNKTKLKLNQNKK